MKGGGVLVRRAISSCPFVGLRGRDSSASNTNATRTAPKVIGLPRSFEEIPEPRSIPLLGTALDYSPLKKFDPSYLGQHWVHRHKELGPIYKENIIPGLTEYIVYTSSPADTEQMLRSEGKCPHRDPLDPLVAVRDQLGEHRGLANSNREEWRRIRKIVNQHFLKNTVVWGYAEKHYQVALDFVEYIKKNLNENGEVPDFSKVLNRWAFESTGVFALDTRLGALGQEISAPLKNMIDHNEIMFKSMGKLLYGLPWWKYYKTREYKRLYKGHDGQVQAAKLHMKRIMDECRENKSEWSNLQSILHSAKMTRDEKIMLLTELLIAGIDTTSNAVAFLLYALATNPEKQEKLREEIHRVLAMDGPSGMALSNAKYLQACIKETQRMFPFVSSISRRYSQDLVLSGHVVPKGTHILNTSNMVNSRNPDCFEKPNTFLPERWLKNLSVKERQEQRFMMSGPFGMGVRMCPGRKFSMQELQMGVTAVLQHFRIEYHHKPIKVAFRLVSFPSEEPQFKFVLLDEHEKQEMRRRARIETLGGDKVTTQNTVEQHDHVENQEKLRFYG